MQSGTGTVNISVDGKSVADGYELSKTANRQAFFVINGLEQGSHKLELTVASGKCSVDVAQVLYDYEAVNKAVTNETSSVTESTDSSDSVPEDNDKSAESNSGNGGNGSFPFVPVAVGAAVVAVAIGAGVAIAKMKKKKD